MSVHFAATDDTTSATGDSPVDPSYFADVDDVRARFADAGYLADERLATTVFLQSRLGKPVLLELSLIHI